MDIGKAEREEDNRDGENLGLEFRNGVGIDIVFDFDFFICLCG